MMRKGVPHAKCNPLCAIKDSLKALWDRAGNCINRINDVSPNGDGDFTITGGANVNVSSDPNGITIDTTGAVAYYSSSDPKLSIDNSNLTIDTVNVASLNDVQTVANDLSTAESDILTLQGQTAIITSDLITETTQRQAADTVLQNNIDAVAASTAGLQGQIDLKRDRSDTVGFYAYTHNGTTQNETAVVDGTTADTMPIRDSAGRMQAADPAAGATDKTLTTANWISQTGSGKPNNLIHDSGNEDVNGTKTCINPQYLKSVSSYYRNTDTKNGWIEVYNFNQNVTSFLIEIMGNSSNDVGYYSKFFITAISPTKGWITFIDSAYQNTAQRIEVLLTHDGTKYAIWCKFVTYRYANVSILRSGRYGTEANTDIITVNGTDHGATKPSTPDYTIIADEVNP